jgi:hypothetical protein
VPSHVNPQIHSQPPLSLLFLHRLEPQNHSKLQPVSLSMELARDWPWSPPPLAGQSVGNVAGPAGTAVYLLLPRDAPAATTAHTRSESYPSRQSFEQRSACSQKQAEPCSILEKPPGVAAVDPPQSPSSVSRASAQLGGWWRRRRRGWPQLPRWRASR